MIDSDPYIPVADAAALMEISERAVYQKLQAGELVPKRAEEKSANGKTATLIQVISMPMEAQVRYFERVLAQPKTPGDAVNLEQLPEGVKQAAHHRLPIVHRALDIIASREAVSSRMELLAAAVGETSRTLYRWAKAWQTDGLPGLLPKWGKTKDTFRAIPDELQTQIQTLYLSGTRPSFTDVQALARQYFEPLGLPVPCVATIAKLLKKIPAAVATYKRIGREAWRKEHEPQCWRDKTVYRPGEMYVGDHRLSDVWVRLGDGLYALIFRPWVTYWLDYRTNACVAKFAATVPDSMTIALSLRDAFKTFGIPRELYVDNGKDYKSHFLNGNNKISKNVGLSDAARALLAKGMLSPLGIEIRHAKAYTPRSKPIEPWFAHALLKWERTLPGWCGNDNQDKPEKLQAERANGELLTFQDFCARLDAHIDEINRTPCNGQGMDNMPPISFWTHDVVIEKPRDERAMDCLLMKSKPVKVTPRGIALFGSKTSPRYYWDPALHLLSKQWAVAYYNPQDLGSLVVYNMDKEFVCVAVNAEAMTMKASEAALRTRAKERRQAEREVRAYPENHRLLMNETQHLQRVINARAAVATAPPSAITAPADVTVVPRLLGTERAAAALRTHERKQAMRPKTPPPVFPEHDHDEIPAALLVDRRRAAAQADDEDAFMQTLLRKKG